MTKRSYSSPCRTSTRHRHHRWIDATGCFFAHLLYRVRDRRIAAPRQLPAKRVEISCGLFPAQEKQPQARNPGGLPQRQEW